VGAHAPLDGVPHARAARSREGSRLRRLSRHGHERGRLRSRRRSFLALRRRDVRVVPRSERAPRRGARRREDRLCRLPRRGALGRLRSVEGAPAHRSLRSERARPGAFQAQLTALAKGDAPRPLLAFPDGPTVGSAACKGATSRRPSSGRRPATRTRWRSSTTIPRPTRRAPCATPRRQRWEPTRRRARSEPTKAWAASRATARVPRTRRIRPKRTSSAWARRAPSASSKGSAPRATR
jgi:hypothetical protein